MAYRKSHFRKNKRGIHHIVRGTNVRKPRKRKK